MNRRLDEAPLLPFTLNICTALLIGRALFHVGRWTWPTTLIAADNNLAEF